MRIDGITYDLSEEIKIEKNKKHTIEIVVDRLVIKEGIKSRLTDSIETVSSLTGGLVGVDVIGGEEMLFSQNYACPEHGVSIDELTPRMFSFNNPFGACEKCTGLGVFKKIDPELIIPNKDLSIRQGAIKASGWNSLEEGSIAMMYFNAISETYGISLDEPVKNLDKDALDIFLYGTQGQKLHLKRGNKFYKADYQAEFEGVIPNLERRYKESNSDWAKADIEAYMSDEKCPACHGERLKKESLSVTVGGINIAELCHKSVAKALEFFENLEKFSPSVKCTLDIKQVMQSGLNYRDFLPAMEGRINNVHLTDYDENGNILRPGKGVVDYYDLFSRLKGIGYDGPMMIELYSGNYDKYSDVKDCVDYLNDILGKVK